MSTRSQSSASTTTELGTTRARQEPIKDQVWRDSMQERSRCRMISLIWPRVLFIVRIHCSTRALLNNPGERLLASLTKRSKRTIRSSIEQSKFGLQVELAEEATINNSHRQSVKAPLLPKHKIIRTRWTLHRSIAA